MNEKIINGIQQIGIGVANAKETFNWYCKHLGFDVLVFNDVATANLMVKYTKGQPRTRWALLAMNMLGGGGLEIWQFKDQMARPPVNLLQLGDLGVTIMKLRSPEIQKTRAQLENLGLELLTEIATFCNKKHFFLKDPWNNLIEIVEDPYIFSKSKSFSGGVLGVVIGVSNMEESMQFYKALLDFDTVVYDEEGIFQDFSGLAGGKNTFRRVMLQHTNRKVGGFGELLGPIQLELVQVLDREPKKIYEKRMWGDLGYIHLCLDVSGMAYLREQSRDMGHTFTVDSSDSFDMGNAAGRFSYVEDPDGTLIEFVETHKVPILKRLGIYINLRNRNPFKPLPKWLVKSMKIHRVKSL